MAGLLLKRIFDVLVAGTGLFLSCPLMLLIALLVKLDSSGPVIYRGKRMGKGGAPFRILKFRTMVADAERRGGSVTYRGDQRITRLGRLLRASKLDELPQLLNVLKGEMSLVGSRAEDPRYREAYKGRYQPILSLPPGMTSLSWVKLRRHDEERGSAGEDWERHYVEVWLPRKLEADLEYVQDRSFWLDLKIIFQTFALLVKGAVAEDDDPSSGVVKER